MTTAHTGLSGVGGLRVSRDVAYRLIDREAIVVDLVGNEVMVLNEVAARFLDLIARGTSAGAAAATLVEEYEVDPPELEDDLLRLVDELLELGIVERVV